MAKVCNVLGMTDQKYEPRAEYTAEEELALWIACRAAITRAQSYSVNLPGGGIQTKTMADLREVNATIDRLRQQVALENAAGDATARPVNYARMTRR